MYAPWCPPQCMHRPICMQKRNIHALLGPKRAILHSPPLSVFAIGWYILAIYRDIQTIFIVWSSANIARYTKMWHIQIIFLGLPYCATLAFSAMSACDRILVRSWQRSPAMGRLYIIRDAQQPNLLKSTWVHASQLTTRTVCRQTRNWAN